MKRPPEIVAGSSWRKSMLGTESIYTVVDVEADLVTVTVRQAPGLEPGLQLKVARQAFAAMERLDPT